VIGGLDSPTGAVVGGLLLGIGLNYVAGYWNSNLTSLVALGILVAVLMIRPNGLFASARMRRV
jgi:branched-chain amino acid transport system permease protein